MDPCRLRLRVEQKGQRETVDAKDLRVQRTIDDEALERDAYVDLSQPALRNMIGLAAVIANARQITERRSLSGRRDYINAH